MFGFVAVVGVVPASFAEASPVLDHCKSAGTGIEAEEGQAPERPGSNAGVVVALPIGRVCVGPDVVDGEHSYVRRITAKEGMAIVEVSTTPFMPVLASNEVSGSIGRPDQPAGW
jgi:hypothetical protein